MPILSILLDLVLYIIKDQFLPDLLFPKLSVLLYHFTALAEFVRDNFTALSEISFLNVYSTPNIRWNHYCFTEILYFMWHEIILKFIFFSITDFNRFISVSCIIRVLRASRDGGF